jgi:hypothetical protein
MKKILIIAAILFFSNFVRAQETKTIQIYDNGITHTNIKAIITYLDGNITKEDVYYTVTFAAMWTGKLSTVVVYNGNLMQMSNFLKSVLQFAEVNKDNIGASTKIEERNVSMTKQFGIKCITIKIGSESINTNFKSINQALDELDKWIKENKKENRST